MEEVAAILRFWFADHDRDTWFGRDANFDAAIARRFGSLPAALLAGRREAWLDTADGRLASLIVLDQFTRNLFRGSPAAFAGDPRARLIARAAIALGEDRTVDAERQLFYYTPFEHSEDLADQDFSLALFTATGDARSIESAEVHRDIIRRFGRFPHRNAALGRATTAEEAAFLKTRLPFY